MDDTLVFGAARVMQTAIGQFAHAISRGDYRATDAEYTAKWPHEGLAPDSIERLQPGGPTLPWREAYPELLLQHHVRSVGLRVCGLGRRSELATLEKHQDQHERAQKWDREYKLATSSKSKMDMAVDGRGKRESGCECSGAPPSAPRRIFNRDG